MTIIWDTIAIIAALIGGFFVLLALTPGMSAPQSASAAAIGIGIAAIPYFLAALNHRQVLLREVRKLTGNQPKD